MIKALILILAVGIVLATSIPAHEMREEQRRELTTCNFNFRGRDKILKEKNFVVKCWECPLLTKAERKTDPDCSNYCCCEDAKDESSCDEPVFEEFDEYCYDECTETGKIVDCAEENASKICPCQCPETESDGLFAKNPYEIRAPGINLFDEVAPHPVFNPFNEDPATLVDSPLD